jgi:hypothetical protein
MKPRFVVAKLPMSGKTVGRSSAGTPNQVARVAPSCSTELVGIQRPRSSGVMSSGPPKTSFGKIDPVTPFACRRSFRR